MSSRPDNGASCQATGCSLAPRLLLASAGTADLREQDLARLRGLAQWAYAYGDHVWRTEDNGRSWRNLTQWKQTSLLGGPVSEAAVRPGVPEEIAVSTATRCRASVFSRSTPSPVRSG